MKMKMKKVLVKFPLTLILRKVGMKRMPKLAAHVAMVKDTMTRKLAQIRAF
jgi:hypothetical protein